jgi:hypothetical protein
MHRICHRLRALGFGRRWRGTDFPGTDLERAQVELHEAADVSAFLDMLEQRYYETDFTDEHRRADRSSVRP